MRILITGVAGFIGSTLADRLVYMGHEVYGIDTFETGRVENLSVDVAGRFMEADVSDKIPFVKKNYDLLIHCAASYKDPGNWPLDAQTNIVGAQTVAWMAQQMNARIIYFQTVLPPISSYAISKIAGEHYLRLSGQPLTVFRLAAVYGPRNLSGAIPTFYRQVKAGLPCTVVEDASRDFVFVEDLVDVVMGNMEFEGHKTYDISTGVETRILEIPGMIGQLLEQEAVMKLIPRPAHDVPHYEMADTPLYGPIVSFHEGLKKAVEWYEQNGVGETFTHLGDLNAPAT